MRRRWVPRAVGLPLLLLDWGRLYPQAPARTGGSSVRPASPQEPRIGGAGNAEMVTRRLSQREANRIWPQHARCRQTSVPTTNGGTRSAPAARVVDAAGGRPPRRPKAAYTGSSRSWKRRSISRGGRESEFRPHRYVPPPEWHGIRTLSVMPRSRSTIETLLSQRFEPRVRQRRLGRLSPMLLERYLSAAQKISRLAVGTPVRSAGAETIVLPPDLTQEDHFDGQSFGTRAGTHVRYTFPADGEYQFELRLTRDRNELIEGLTEPHQMEVSVDRTRLQVFTLSRLREADRTTTSRRRTCRNRRPTPPELPRRASTGGPHVVQVAFIKRPSALVETERQPYLASYNSDRTPRTQPGALQRVDCRAVQPERIGDTPRRAHLSCRPAKATETAMRANNSFHAGAPASPAPLTVLKSIPFSVFYKQGRAEGSFELGIEMALRAMLTSTQFLLRSSRVRGRSAEGGTAGSRLRVRRSGSTRTDSLSGWDLERSRLSFFSGAAFPTTSCSMRPKGRAQGSGRARAAGAAHAGRRPLRGAREQLRRAVAVLAQSHEHAARLRLFPDFDDNLRQAFRRETELLFESVMKEDRSVLDLLRADYTFLNERLAQALRDSEHVRQPLPARRPRDRIPCAVGCSAQGSIMTVTSYANRTSPVLRGKWILENLLGTPPRHR